MDFFSNVRGYFVVVVGLDVHQVVHQLQLLVHLFVLVVGDLALRVVHAVHHVAVGVNFELLGGLLGLVDLLDVLVLVFEAFYVVVCHFAARVEDEGEGLEAKAFEAFVVDEAGEGGFGVNLGGGTYVAEVSFFF